MCCASETCRVSWGTGRGEAMVRADIFLSSTSSPSLLFKNYTAQSLVPLEAIVHRHIIYGSYAIRFSL